MLGIDGQMNRSVLTQNKATVACSNAGAIKVYDKDFSAQKGCDTLWCLIYGKLMM